MDKVNKEIVLSIIIPMYNVEAFIGRLIHELASQMNDSIELILVDDGSSDSTLSVVNEIKRTNQEKNIVIISQKNCGCSTARNTGIDNSNGSYITFIDSDDMVKNDYLKTFVELIEKYPSNDLWLTGTLIYDVNGNLYDVRSNPNKQLEGNEAVIRSVIYDEPTNALSMHCKIFSSEFLKNNKIRFFDQAKCMSDGTFLLSCYLHANRIYLSDYSGYEWRRREGSITTTYYDNLPEIVSLYLNLCKELCTKYPSDDLEDKWMPRQKRYCFEYQIGKIDGSKRSGVMRKNAIEDALKNSIDIETAEKYYSDYELAYMKKAISKQSSFYYELLVNRKKFELLLAKAKNYIKRRIPKINS